MALNRRRFNVAAAAGSPGPRMHGYRSETDNIAAIEAAGYFNELYSLLKTGDTIFYVGTNGWKIADITVDTGAKTVTLGTKLTPA